MNFEAKLQSEALEYSVYKCNHTHSNLEFNELNQVYGVSKLKLQHEISLKENELILLKHEKRGVEVAYKQYKIRTDLEIGKVTEKHIIVSNNYVIISCK